MQRLMFVMKNMNLNKVYTYNVVCVYTHTHTNTVKRNHICMYANDPKIRQACIDDYI